ncbi:MAG: hypothetical protein PF450_09395 [Bacteroidales bacterium]|nr:hypothetical protein [Bacteroidales bacterium]
MFFVVTVKNSNNTYKDEISSLEQRRDSLETRLENSVSKDSILYYLEQQGRLGDLIATLNEELDSLKDIQNEDIDFAYLSIDSNIVILTDYLSE